MYRASHRLRWFLLALTLATLALVMACRPAAAPTPTKAPATPIPTAPAPVEATPVIRVETPTPTPPAEKPQYGGIFRTHAGDDLVHFDQMLQTTVRTQQRVGPSYNRLMRFSFFEVGVIVPDLAERFEVSKDGLTYTFYLRPGVKFHEIPGVPGSGTDLDCPDVKHTLDKYRNPEWSKRAGDLAAVDSIECSPNEPLKVVIKLKSPDAALVAKVSAGWAGIMPSELPWDKLKDTVIGTGPYIWQGYTKGQKSVSKKNPNYWRKGLPYMDEIHNFVFPREEVSFAAFRAKQLDMNSYMQYIYPSEAKILKENHPEVIVSLPPRLWWHFAYGNMKSGPWSDIRVRQAFNLAIDRPKSVEILGEGVGDYGAWQPPWTKWSLPRSELDKFVGKKDSSDMPARREQAMKLLQEAGYSTSKPLKMVVDALNTRESMLTPTYMQDEMKKLGGLVELTLNPLDRAAWNDRLEKRAFEMQGSGSAVAPFIEPSLFYGNYFPCNAPANYMGYCNPEFDKLFSQILSELDEAKRQQLVWQAERLLLTDLPAIPVRWIAEGMAWWPWVKNFKDVDPAYYNNVTMEEVWLDRNHPGYPR